MRYVQLVQHSIGRSEWRNSLDLAWRTFLAGIVGQLAINPNRVGGEGFVTNSSPDIDIAGDAARQGVSLHQDAWAERSGPWGGGIDLQPPHEGCLGTPALIPPTPEY